MVVSAYAPQALAAPTELANGVTVAATNANGVTETNATNAITIDSTGGAITLGANGTPSVIQNFGGGTLTIAVDTSGTANGVIFADNLVETAGDIVLNIVDDNVTFQGNMSNSPITVGSGSANPTDLLTVNTANAENITFAGSIDAVDSGDTVNLTVLNGNAGANTVTFSAAVGGSVAIDAITVGADDTKAMDVTFGANVGASTITLGTGNAANNTSNVRFGTAAGTSVVTGVISGAGAADTDNITVVGGSTVTFASAFGSNIDAIQVGSNGTNTNATFKAAVASGPITIGAGAGVDTNVVTLDTTGGIFTVTPAINGGNAADNNTLAVTGGNVATVTGAIGAGGAGVIDAITLSTSGSGLTTGGAVTATTITIGTGTSFTPGGTTTATDTNFSGTSGTVTVADGLTYASNVDNTSGSNGAGSLIFSGNATLTGNVGATKTLSVFTAGGTGKTVAQTGNLALATTNNLNGNTVTTTGTVTSITGQTINTAITSPTAIGHITSGGAATVNAGTLVVVDVQTTGFIANGTTFKVIDGTGGAGVATLTDGNITDNSFIMNFVQDTSSTSDLILEAVRQTTGVSTTSNNSSAGAALDDLGTDGDDLLDDLQDSLIAAATAQEVNDILESVQTTVDGSAVTAAVNVSDTTAGLTSDRLAFLRNGGETGMSAGDSIAGQGLHVWGQVFGQASNQDRRDGIDGYDSHTWGGAVGMDSGTNIDKGTLGIAVSYGNTDADSDNINRTNTDVDSYQVSLYGDYNLPQNSYVSGLLGYGWNSVETVRHDVGGFGIDAHGDFDARQITAQVEAGQDIKKGNATITPNVLAHWANYSPNSYTETGAGGLGLHVDGKALNVFELGVGAKAGWNLSTSDGSKFKPEVRAGYRYDLVGDNIESTSNFTGGGATFTTQGPDPARSTFDVGATLKLETVQNWDFTASYDFNAKADYTSHAGFIRAGYKF